MKIIYKFIIICVIWVSIVSGQPQEPDALLEMRGFLENDTSDVIHRQQTTDYYCMHRSIDLAQNMTNSGYEVGCVLISFPYKKGHMIVWAHLGGAYNETVYIEPYNDEIYDTDPYIECVSAKFTNININRAKRLLYEQERWRQ